MPELRTSVSILIRRSLADDDDEVRDRAAVILKSFEVAADDGDLRFLLDEPLPMTFGSLELSVNAYFNHDSSDTDFHKLTFASLPIIEEAVAPKKDSAKKVMGSKKVEPATTEDKSEVVDPAADLYKIPELASLGRAFRASTEIPLTESEMEYVVKCTKFIFDNHIVLKFSILNTVDSMRLKNVNVNIEVGDPDEYAVEGQIAAEACNYGEAANCYTILRRFGEPVGTSLEGQLTFVAETVDTVTGEGDGDDYEDETPLESFDITTGDFMAKRTLGDFRRAWEQMDAEGEHRELRIVLQKIRRGH